VAFEDPVTLVYLHFVAYLASCVTPFLLMFQSSQPVVHVLYQKANELVRQCMLLFMKPDVVAENEGRNLTEVRTGWKVGRWRSVVAPSVL